MPTEQPSNAPDTLPAQPGEEASVAAVLTDEQMDDTPGGGGLGGAAAAADPLGGSGRSAEATSRNNPATPDVVAPYPADDGAREAALQALENPPAEKHPSSL